MKVFLGGVACVGKTAIGECLSHRLGCSFFDLDKEIEKRIGKPIERLKAEALTPYSFRKQFASVVLNTLLEVEPQPDFVMALMPSGLMDCMWAILKNVDRVVVILHDSAENILARITFYDADSRRITKPLSDEERLLHLRDIKKDISYFGRTFHRADLMVDISGLDIEGSAAKIEALLREQQAGG